MSEEFYDLLERAYQETSTVISMSETTPKSKTTNTVERTSPACNGREKSYGTHMYSCCMDDHQVIETVIIEHEDIQKELADTIDDAVREVLSADG